MNEPQLDVVQLAKLYPGNRGLRSASFTVKQGELIAVVGPNGAGKSTLLKLLSRWLIPDGGHFVIHGGPPREQWAAARRAGFVPEAPNLHESFSVAYNLNLFIRLFGVPRTRLEDTLREFRLQPFRNSTVRTLSKGMKQRVSIGRSLLADPPLLLMDEPTSALDRESTEEVHRLIRHFHVLGKTILFTSHRVDEITSLATRVLALREGRIVFDGLPEAYEPEALGRTG